MVDKGNANGNGQQEADIESVLGIDGLCCSSEVTTLKVPPRRCAMCY